MTWKRTLYYCEQRCDKSATDHYDRGVAHYLDGEYDQAFSKLTKAIEIAPMIYEAYRGRAGAYHYKGEYDKAWKDVYEAQPLGRQVDSKLLK